MSRLTGERPASNLHVAVENEEGSPQKKQGTPVPHQAPHPRALMQREKPPLTSGSENQWGF